jgi:hypothetical protein
MARKSKSHFASVIAVIMTACFLVTVGYCYSIQSRVDALRQGVKVTASAEVKSLAPAVTGISKPTPSAEAATASPKPTPEPEPTDPNSELLLQQQLAAAQTGEMLMSLSSTAQLEDRTTYTVPVEHKFVYLTFDDGPSQYTPRVLEILRKNGIKATFFVEYNPNQEYYRQIAADGHTLALHTYTHDYKKVYASEDAFFDDLNRISSYVKDITGIDSKIVRVAGGSSNTISRHYSTGIMTRITGDLDNRGYVYFDWNAQCDDATTLGISPENILKNVKSFSTVNGQSRLLCCCSIMEKMSIQRRMRCNPSLIITKGLAMPLSRSTGIHRLCTSPYRTKKRLPAICWQPDLTYRGVILLQRPDRLRLHPPASACRR